MCGIIAYAGSEPVTPILVSGLRTLEYRGYDSAGIGVQAGNGKSAVIRALGVDDLAEAVAGQNWNGGADQAKPEHNSSGAKSVHHCSTVD